MHVCRLLSHIAVHTGVYTGTGNTSSLFLETRSVSVYKCVGGCESFLCSEKF